MFKQSIIIVSLIGLTWAGTAQAGFLGNNLELQWLQNSILATTNVNVTSDPTNASIMGIDVAIGDTSLGLSGNANLPTDLSIVDINDSLDPIIAASGIGNVSYGQNSEGHQYILISGLNGPIDSGVDVSFGTPIQLQEITVPEPGAFELVVLGLTMLLITSYLRRRAYL